MIENRAAAAARTAFLCCILASGAAWASDIEAGPIWNNKDATVKCPKVCAAARKHWNGNWHTTVWTVMSVCNCDDAAEPEAISMRRDGSAPACTRG